MCKPWNVKFSEYHVEVKREIAKPVKQIWDEFQALSKDEFRTDTKKWFDKVGYLNAIELLQRRVELAITRADNQILTLSTSVEIIERKRKAIGITSEDQDLARDKFQLNWLATQRKPAMEKFNEHLLSLMVELATSKPKAKRTTSKSTGTAKATRSKSKEVKPTQHVDPTPSTESHELPF